MTNNPTLNKLEKKKKKIYEGWQDRKKKCAEALHGFWNFEFRDKLTIEDSLILKGICIVVPPNLREEMISVLHQEHLGKENCRRRAGTSTFWPGITKDVTNLAKECNSCQRHQRKQQKEPIIQLSLAELSSDLFKFKGHQYLLILDQYNKFPIISNLTSTNSPAIITRLKSIFAEHGILTQLVTYWQWTIVQCKGIHRLNRLVWSETPYHFPNSSARQRNGTERNIGSKLSRTYWKSVTRKVKTLTWACYRTAPVPVSGTLVERVLPDSPPRACKLCL